MPGPISRSNDDGTPPPPDNPNPRRFTIEATYREGNAVAVRIHYPDCTNYEGRKILVYDDAAGFRMRVAVGNVDPHFTEKGASPIARFRPDEVGWQFACALVDGLGGRAL